MIHKTLTYSPRTIIGTQVRKIRKQGLLPAIVYGNKLSNKTISIDQKEFSRLYKAVGNTTVVDLCLDGSQDKLSCLIHDIDIDPVKGFYRHVDFLAVDLKKKVESEVPLNFFGDVSKESEGVLVKNISTLEVEALPENIPHTIEIDLSLLKKIGDVINVSSLPIAKKYEIVSDPETVIASLVGQSVEVESVDATIATEQTTTDNKSKTTSEN